MRESCGSADAAPRASCTDGIELDSEQTGVGELRQLRQLQEENARQAGGERATPTAMSCPARHLFRLHALGKDYGIAASNSQTKRD